MTTMTRRTVISAALATATAPAAIAIPAITAEHPDADVFDLVAKLKQAEARELTSVTASEAAAEAVSHWMEINPEPKIREREHDVPKSLWQEFNDRLMRTTNADAIEADKAAHVAWEERKTAAEREFGRPEAQAKADAASSDWADACDELAASRAVTIEGIRAKAHAALNNDSEELAWSIVDDLVNLDENTAAYHSEVAS